MKEIWSSRVAEVSQKYGENAPLATACCNACRTCVTTNLVGLALAGVAASWGSTRRLFIR